MKSKPRIGIITTHIDGRLAKGTAIATRHLISSLVPYRDRFDISLIHREHSEDILYRKFSEILMPQISLPRFSGILSEFFFYVGAWLRGNVFDIMFYPYARLNPLFFLAPARKIIFMAMDGGARTAWSDAPKDYGSPTHVIPRLCSFRITKYLAFSAFGKRGISATFHVSPERVAIVPCGVHKSFMPMEISSVVQARLERTYGIQFPYILDVSRFDPHKNILNVLEAYALLVQKGRPEHLVFVGGAHLPDYSAQVSTRIRELRLEDRVHVTPFVAEDDLPYVYSAARVLVYPSLYEGFGLPLVEAMACGCACVTSNTSSLPEVGGDAVLTVDAQNFHDIASAVERVLTDEVLRRDLIQKGLRRSSLFSWEQAGSALIEVFEGVSRK